jgi:hypothetical protein
MIAHVAQAGEDRGRVVLHLRSGCPSAIALEAAVRIARAFQSEIESVFVQDEQLMDCADYDFVREMSLTGRQQRPMSRDAVARDMHLAAVGARRQIEELARRAEVPLRSRVVRDEPLRALSIACAETGPWNVVALAEPFTGSTGGMLKQLLVEIAATGLVLVGPQARASPGRPSLPSRIPTPHHAEGGRAPGRPRRDRGCPLLVASDDERLQWMDGGAPRRRARDNVRIVPAEVHRGEAAVIAETLRALARRFRHRPVRRTGCSRRKSAPARLALECPLFLVR